MCFTGHGSRVVNHGSHRSWVILVIGQSFCESHDLLSALVQNGKNDFAGRLTYFPAVFGHEIAGKRCEDECSNAGAADRDAVRQRPTLVEVKADRHDGRQVEQTYADTCTHLYYLRFRLRSLDNVQVKCLKVTYRLPCPSWAGCSSLFLPLSPYLVISLWPIIPWLMHHVLNHEHRRSLPATNCLVIVTEARVLTTCPKSTRELYSGRPVTIQDYLLYFITELIKQPNKIKRINMLTNNLCRP